MGLWSIGHTDRTWPNSRDDVRPKISTGQDVMVPREA